MNAMLLLAQVAPAMADSIAGANPVLTPVAGPEEMSLWSMAVKGGWIMVVLGLHCCVSIYCLNGIMLSVKQEKKILCLWIKLRIISWLGR